ncbi:MAG: diguanylate cyclase [Acidobacteria bacterium]|nr:diguanylate cyclase [Acidobacteriota bacterium]
MTVQSRRNSEPKPSPILILVSALVLIYCGLNFRFQIPQAANPLIGVTMPAQAAGPALVERVEPEGPAEMAGVRAGDELVVVNGRSIGSWAEYDGARDLRQASQPMSILLRRDGRLLEVEVHARRRLGKLEVVLGIIFSLVSAGVGLLCYLRSPHDRRTQVALLLFLSFAAVNSNFTGDPYESPGMLAMRLLNDCSYSLGFGLLWLLPFYVPEPIGTMRRRESVATLALFLPGILWQGLSWWQSFGERDFGEWPGRINTALLYATFLLLPAVSWLQSRRHRTGAARQQARTLFAGFLVYGLLNGFAIASLDYWPESPLASSFFTQHVDVLVPLTVFFAVYRHRLFDIDVIIRRGLIYTATSTVLLGVYLVLAASISSLLPGLLGDEDAVMKAALAGLSVGLLVAPARRASQRVVDRLFYRTRFDYLGALPTLFSELAATVDPSRHGAILIEKLESAFQPQAMALLLPDEEGQRFLVRASRGIALPAETAEQIILHATDARVAELAQRSRPLWVDSMVAAAVGADERNALEALRAELLVPLRLKDRLVAILVLGAKSSETSYNAEEMAFLTAVAGQSAALLENGRLLELASRDGLTGLLRRSAFEPIFEREILRSRRHDHPLALMMLDLDHFKSINDRFGHRAGDVVLKRVAATLRQSLRATDTIGRFGGEEFVVLLPETDPEGARRLAESLRTSIQDQAFALPDGTPMLLTVSIGVCALAGAELPQALEIEDRADAAMYAAKRAGRNRVMLDREAGKRGA